MPSGCIWSNFSSPVSVRCKEFEGSPSPDLTQNRDLCRKKDLVRTPGGSWICSGQIIATLHDQKTPNGGEK